MVRLENLHFLTMWFKGCLACVPGILAFSSLFRSLSAFFALWVHLEFTAILGPICVCIEVEFITQEVIHICVFVFGSLKKKREIPEEGGTYVCLIQIDGAQHLSRVYVH